MARGKEFKTKGTYTHRMDRKANESPLIFARAGDGGGTVATGRTNFYWIRLINDDNRLTQCYSLIPVANNDWIYVREAKDRKLRYYEFAAFIQDAAGGTAPPIQTHDHSAAGEGGQLDWDDIWTDAVHTHANNAEGGQLDWDNVWTDAIHDHSAAGEGGQLDWDDCWADAIHDHSAAGEGGQLDWDNVWSDAVHDHSSNAEGGQNLRQIQELEFDDATILTIAGGTVTRTQAYHIIASGTDAADNLDQIDGGVQGDLIIIKNDTGDTITVRHNQGGAGDNIWLAGGADIVLNNDDHLALLYDGTWWCDLSGGAGAAAGNTLDAAYDQGGAGAGRTITADAGAVQIDGAGGLGSQGNIVLDDGVSDSPDIQWIGGSNNDTARMWLDDDAGAGLSDLIIRLAGTSSSTSFIIEDSLGAVRFSVHADGDVEIPGAIDLNGTGDIRFDGDYDTYMTAPVDDELRIYIGTFLDFSFTPNAFNVLNGSVILVAAGGLIDLNGVADALVLSADGDTTISAPTDGQIDFETETVDTVRIIGASTDDANVWRIGGEVLDLDFTGVDFNTFAECNAVGLRFYANDSPYPTTHIVPNAGSWSHSAGNGWQPASAVNDQGPGLMIPLCRPGNWELEFVLTYSAANVAHGGGLLFGYLATSNNYGAYATVLDTSGAAHQLVCTLRTNDGDDTPTTRYTGAALAGTGDRTYRLRSLTGTVGVWDEVDDAWHNYEGRYNAGHAYNAAFLFIQAFKQSTMTLATMYIKSLKVTYLL